ALSDEDIHALYSRATLFALPPKELVGDYEGFGIVYCEAAFFGLPVVATRTGGIPEAVKDNETGILVEPGNSNAIADAILQLLDNPALATHYGEVGKQRVLDLFQWNSIISDLEELLHPYESR
ncbi:MAG TPA: glycosyltransferase family 4 protein, partial [Candidatus Andersenbacteria bacterium]|nr:glycosyltransferase family 4 protein [Candidatus Andersenbacteria bacterium]